MPVTLIDNYPDFKRAIAQSKVSVIDFFAVWCGPCKAVAPTFDNLSKQFASNANFYKVNVDNLPEVSKDCGVTAMPTFQIYKSGKLLETIIGANVAELTRKIQQHCTSSSGGFEGTGRVLGSGAKVGSGSVTGNVSNNVSNFISSPNGLVWVAIAFLVLYWWKANKNRDAFEMDF